MRILHILDHSIPLQSGYAFRTLSILTQQRALGWETIHVTTPRHTAPFVPKESIDGWEFFRTPPLGPVARRVPILREILEMRATARRVAEICREHHPDILHAHSPVLNALPAIKVGRRLGIKVLYEVRAFWEDAAASHGTSRPGGLRYGLTKALETAALRRADAVTTICEGLRHEILARGIPSAKVTVIPNGVDAQEFPAQTVKENALAEELGLTNRTVLGFVGSFYEYEGLNLLIDSLPMILKERSDVRLLLVGGGPEANRLRSQARDLGIADKVVFTGRVPHDQVSRYYALIDVLVYPRHAMRLTDLVTPLKPLEAMAQRKILIASDVGGHRELIRDGETGHLFSAGDVRSLVAVVHRVLRSQSDWDAQRDQARNFVETERSWAKVVARYVPVYGRLIASPA